MKIVTWNIWFASFENASRWDALISEVLAERPDVIALQEVTAPVMERIRVDPRLSSWWCSDPHLDVKSHYDVVLLVSLPPVRFERVQLTSRMGRALVHTRISGLTVGTVHLESLRPSVEWRARQLAEISAAFAQTPDVLFMGDMNFADGDLEDELPGAPWRDLWRELHPARDGFTVDTERNVMRQLSKDGRYYRGRYDRVFLKSERWVVKRARLLGDEPIGEDPTTFPSDHFGVSMELCRR